MGKSWDSNLHKDTRSAQKVSFHLPRRLNSVSTSLHPFKGTSIQIQYTFLPISKVHLFSTSALFTKCNISRGLRLSAKQTFKSGIRLFLERSNILIYTFIRSINIQVHVVLPGRENLQTFPARLPNSP